LVGQYHYAKYRHR